MTDGPRYSEDEVALILRRAAELQKQEPLPGDSRSMSLEEIEAAAHEAGLSRALVRRAATEIARPTPNVPAPNPFLGAPSHLVIERVVEGEYPVESFDRLLEIIRFGDLGPGSVSTVGRSLSWTGTLGGSQAVAATIAISARDGQTRIRIHGRFNQLAGAVFGGIGGGAGGGLSWAVVTAGIFAGGAVGGAVLGILFLGGVYALCRKVYSGQVKVHTNTLTRVADELEHAIKGQLALVEAPGA
jgi:hypothetical protein